MSTDGKLPKLPHWGGRYIYTGRAGVPGVTQLAYVRKSSVLFTSAILVTFTAVLKQDCLVLAFSHNVYGTVVAIG